MEKLFLISTVVLSIVSASITAQSSTRSPKIAEGHWAYKTVQIAGEERHYPELNECGFREGLTIKSGNEIHEYTIGDRRLRGYQFAVSDDKFCLTDPVTFQLVVMRNACETNWVRLSDDPTRLIRISEGGIFEYEIKLLSKRSMLFLKVQELTNYGLQVPDRIEWEWVKGSVE